MFEMRRQNFRSDYAWHAPEGQGPKNDQQSVKEA